MVTTKPLVRTATAMAVMNVVGILQREYQRAAIAR